jgi:putative NADH-flavin reductase
MELLILGASGGVGRLAVDEALARGWRVRAQTRSAGRVAAREGVTVCEGAPTDAAALARMVAGCDAALFALGVDTTRPTTLFSDATRALVGAMRGAGVRRLVAITGVGAGETRGHGGWLYDRVIFPLFTRNRYADKERQEALIRDSGLDWTIVRPAAFAARAGDAPFEAHAAVTPDLVLRSVTREEVARFALDALEDAGWIGRAAFIGRR